MQSLWHALDKTFTHVHSITVGMEGNKFSPSIIANAHIVTLERVLPKVCALLSIRRTKAGEMSSKRNRPNRFFPGVAGVLVLAAIAAWLCRHLPERIPSPLP